MNLLRDMRREAWNLSIILYKIPNVLKQEIWMQVYPTLSSILPHESTTKVKRSSVGTLAGLIYEPSQ